MFEIMTGFFFSLASWAGVLDDPEVYEVLCVCVCVSVCVCVLCVHVGVPGFVRKALTQTHIRTHITHMSDFCIHTHMSDFWANFFAPLSGIEHILY